MQNSQGKTVLIVSHGAAIANFYRYWEHTSEVKRNGAIQNCSLFDYAFSEGQFMLNEIIEHDFHSISE